MKTKTFIILIIIAAVLSLGGYFLVQSQKGKSGKSMMGRSLFRELPADRIAMITIQGPDESVRLKKTEDRWVVQSRLNYPADFQKLSELVRNLREAKIGRVFESSQGSLKRLALIDPTREQGEGTAQEKGLRIVFMDKDGQQIKSILFGKAREAENGAGPAEGHYLKLPDDSKIYLVDKDFSTLEPLSLEWMETELTDIPAADIKAILCRGPDNKNIRYHFERPEKGKDFEAVHFPKGKKVKPSTLNQLSSALASLNMENVVDPSASPESPIEMSNLIEYHLFNGLIYRIRPSDGCSQDDSCYVRIEVAYQKPPAQPEDKDGALAPAERKKKDEEKAESRKDLSQQAAKLNEQFKPWTYIIPRWKKDDFITDVTMLVETEPQDGAHG